MVAFSTAIVSFGVAPAFAGPVTNPYNAPFVKTAVYGGVIGISTAAEAMEIGNVGKDIAGTAALYIQPGRLSTTQGASVTVKSPFAEGALAMGSGRLCLNTTQSNNLADYTCFTSWPTGGSGDTNWNRTTVGPDTKLTPIAGIDLIRIGTETQPAAIGIRALDVYANSVQPAFYSDGFVTFGRYNSTLFYDQGGSIVINGQLRIPDPYGSLTSLNTNSPGFGFDPVYRPWSKLDTYNAFSSNNRRCLGGANAGLICTNTSQCPGGFCPKAGPTGIDADTFDGAGAPQSASGNAVAALFNASTDHNLFFRDASLGPEICLKVNAAKLCVGGTTPGKVCTVAGDCVGGTCTNMCGMTPKSCPVPTVYHCNSGTNAGNVCTPSNVVADCGFNAGCNLGVDVMVSHGASAFCVGGLSCAQACAGQLLSYCDGKSGPGVGSCGAYGTTATATTGTITAGDYYLGGSCVPNYLAPGNWGQHCDCYNDVTKTYYQADASSTVLCTPNITGT